MFTLKKANESETLQQLLNSAKSLLIIKQTGGALHGNGLSRTI